MVIEKAAGMRFAEYVAKHVAGPLGVHNVLISPTVGSRVEDEVAKYYSAYRGLSAVYVLSKKRYAYPYGGDDMVLEVAGGAAALATSADSMLEFMNEYLIWGVGTPEPGADWAREGSMPGTNTWAEQLLQRQQLLVPGQYASVRLRKRSQRFRKLTIRARTKDRSAIRSRRRETLLA